jgi:hypothetical protein
MIQVKLGYKIIKQAEDHRPEVIGLGIVLLKKVFLMLVELTEVMQPMHVYVLV